MLLVQLNASRYFVISNQLAIGCHNGHRGSRTKMSKANNASSMRIAKINPHIKTTAKVRNRLMRITATPALPMG